MSKSSKEKTLVILNGNPRGGEKTWHSMYDNLLEPYNADLALCFGYREDKSLSLYSKAKYIWEIPEYENWEDYYIEHIGDNFSWKKSFELGADSGFSGLYKTIGSGAIWCVFLHYVYTYKKHILHEYDRIIMTRADHYYVNSVEVLSNDYFWVPSGDHYGGINDKFHIFPSKDIDNVIGIITHYINTESFFEDFKNCSDVNLEKSFLNYLNKTGYIEKLKIFPRCFFLVKTKLDNTRWTNGVRKVPHNFDLWVKYENEFKESVNNLPQGKKFEALTKYKHLSKRENR
jgi:hypothetical protein